MLASLATLDSVEMLDLAETLASVELDSVELLASVVVLTAVAVAVLTLAWLVLVLVLVLDLAVVQDHAAVAV